MFDQAVFYLEVGRRVRIARERIGLTQDALASQVMLSRTSVTNIEKGRQKVMAHTICNLAEALNIPPSELFPALGQESIRDDKATAENPASSTSRPTSVPKRKRGNTSHSL